VKNIWKLGPAVRANVRANAARDALPIPSPRSNSATRILVSAAAMLLHACAAAQSPLPVRESDYASPIRLACVGDSITHGHLIPNRERASFPAQLQRLLGAKWQVGNFGRSGATLLRKSPRPYHEQQECAAALAFRPDVVVLQLGTNDTKRETWEAEGTRFVSDYLELIRSFQALDSKPRIIVCRPIPLFRDRGKDWDTDRVLREQILPKIDEVARQTKLPLIDLNATFADQAALVPDGVHPNAAGATLMARTIFGALTGRQPLESPTTRPTPTASNPSSADTTATAK
jgi:acyl-CoA thioesterase I